MSIRCSLSIWWSSGHCFHVLVIYIRFIVPKVNKHNLLAFIIKILVESRYYNHQRISEPYSVTKMLIEVKLYGPAFMRKLVLIIGKLVLRGRVG